MIAQTFRGATLDDAQAAARAALGEGAVILTARRVQRRGLRGMFGGMDVEIAAQPPAPPTPPPPPPAPPPPSDKTPASRMPFSRSAYADEAPKARISESVPPPTRPEARAMAGLVARAGAAATNAAANNASVESELAALRDAVDRLSEPSVPRSGAMSRVLRETGLEGKAAAELLRLVKLHGGSPNVDSFRDALADLVRVTPWPLAEQGPALIAMVGPSGVGKTTTTAKLAARAMHEMNKTVTFVTCDGVRVGAYEQIDRYADLLGARIVPARSPADVQRAVETADTDLVFVDTAGRSPTRLDSPERALRNLPGTRRPRARIVLLALPASIRADDAARFAREYAVVGPTAMVVTKLDETVVPAGLVHGAIAAKLPISVLCFGQNVPDDIAPATTGAILDYLLPKGARRRPS